MMVLASKGVLQSFIKTRYAPVGQAVGKALMNSFSWKKGAELPVFGGENCVSFKLDGSEKTFSGHLTSKVIDLVAEIPPLAKTSNLTVYVAASLVVRLSYLQASDESGVDGQAG